MLKNVNRTRNRLNASKLRAWYLYQVKVYSCDKL